MTCAACVARVERTLAALEGVERAEVNLATGRATLSPAAAGLAEAAEAALAAIGYGARLPAGGERARTAPRDQDAAAMGRRALFAACFTGPLVALAMAQHAGLSWDALLSPRGWMAVELALALPVQFVAGGLFYRLAWRELRHLAPAMNSLVAIGSSAAFGYSLLATVAPGLFPAGTAHSYFEAAAAIVTLVLAGRAMEQRARARTGDAVRRLLALAPATARVRRREGELELPLAALRPGDVVVVAPGERLPVDGEVIEGEGPVDEAAMTGEPLPVAKAAGDRVTGGTLNGSGALVVRATHVGADAVLAQIVATVERAQGSKPPVQRLADRVAAVFVPAAMAAAAIAFASWLLLAPAPALPQALIAAVSVLLVACPCAVGLAVPAAVTVAAGRGAALGVLLADAAALERLARVDTVLFDKTGTLTEGRPELVAVAAAPGRSEDEALALAASLERLGSHPAGRAIAAAAQARGLPLHAASDGRARAGMGIAGTVAGRRLALGSDRFMAVQGVDAAPLAAAAHRHAAAGATTVFMAADGEAAALFALADRPSPGTREAVARLAAMGLAVAMATGDSPAAGGAIARRLGIGEVAGGLMPDDKAREIARLRRRGRRVAFVGDGINDAPALAAADVAIAIGSGSDLAVENADIVLMSGGAMGAVRAVALARRTLATIRQNLLWAFLYNALLIPVAAGALQPVAAISLHPAMAAAAMTLSSLFVIANALRLNRFDPA